jgi:hypothetical protein
MIKKEKKDTCFIWNLSVDIKITQQKINIQKLYYLVKNR